ncbi:MAG: DUF2807 domain-containing protein [Bacteroidota bacterium]
MKTSNKIILGAILLATIIVLYIPVKVIGFVNKSVEESGSFELYQYSDTDVRDFISDSSFKTTIGQGNEVNKTVNIDKSFAHLKISGAARIELYQKQNISVELSDYENLIALTEIKVVADTLLIKYKDEINLKNLKTKVKISLPNLKSITCENNRNEIKTVGDFNFDTLDLSVAGSSNFRMRGKVNNLKLNVSGKSYAQIRKLICKNASYDISATGNGTIETTVTDTMNAEISGYGRIFYKGTPKKINKNISGGGDIIEYPLTK